MKAVDSHRDCLKPLFDMVSLAVVELTAQLVSKEGSQKATSINQKLRLWDIVFLSEAMQERRRGIGPAAAEYIDFEQ